MGSITGAPFLLTGGQMLLAELVFMMATFSTLPILLWLIRKPSSNLLI